MTPAHIRLYHRFLAGSVTLWGVDVVLVCLMFVGPPVVSGRPVAILGLLGMIVGAAAVCSVCAVVARVLPPVATAWFLGHRDGVLDRERHLTTRGLRAVD